MKPSFKKPVPGETEPAPVRTRNYGLTCNLLLLVCTVSFGTWFSMGFNIVALNGIESVIVSWIQGIGCDRLGGPDVKHGTAETHRNYSRHDLWCQRYDHGNNSQERKVAEILAENSLLNTLWALTSSLFSLGGLVSAFLSGVFIKRFGLKVSILINAGVLIIGTVISCLSQLAGSFEMLIMGRITVGFAVGTFCVLTPIYTSELTPAALRGALGTLPTTTFVLGMILGTTLGLPNILGSTGGWPVLLALHLVPVLVMCIVLSFCPESPRYLFISQNKKEEAKKALIWLRNSSDVEEELTVMQEEMDTEKSRHQITMLELLCHPFLRGTLWLCAIPMSAMHLSGYSCLSFYSTSIFTAGGLTHLDSIYASLGLWSTFLLTNVTSLALVDRLGRRILLLISHSGVLLSLCFLVLTMALTKQGITWTKYGSVASIFTFIVSHGLALFSVPWILGAELFTQESRPAGMTLISIVCWVTELTATLLFPLIIAGAQEYTFIIFITFVLLTGCFTWLKVPETKGRSIEEIQVLLHKCFVK